jgi:hypothetical protein
MNQQIRSSNMARKGSSSSNLHGLHLSEQRVLIAACTKQEFKVDKQLIKLQVPTDDILTLNKSLWGTVKHVDWDAMAKWHSGLKDVVLKIAMYKGLVKLYQRYNEEIAKAKSNMKEFSRKLCVCAVCFDDPNKPLTK